MNRKVQYSIVMPAYNTEKYIGEAITSVFNQTVSDWELIVIDDGSTDNTAEVARQFSDPRIKIFSQNNSGISASRNKGIEVSGGRFIIFFDSDDRLCPDALERLGAALRNNDKTIAVYGECITINETGKLIGTGKKPIFNVRPSGNILQPLDAAFTNPEITGHIGIQELKRSRCMIEAAAFSATACTALRARNWKTAASYLFKSLKRNPVPVRIREVILLCCALLRWLPHPVKRRLR